MPRPLHNTMMRGSYDDEDLLEEGRYREWFWSGFDAGQTSWLKAPVKVPSPPEPEPIFKNQEFPQVKRWRDKAACKDTDPVVFFGVEGTDLKKQYLNPRAKWRKLCPQCPVRDLCLELARDSESEGIFGGKLFQFYQGTVDGVRDSYKTLHEYDDESMPRRGRPRKPKPLNKMSQAERDKAWNQMQKEINDRISAAGTH